MASDNEASCVSDPNFAVICSFLEKFGSACGITSPDFMELQEMLENTQEVSPELIDLHIKLLRKVRRSVSGDRWERALIKLCHSYCSQDAWELERFGYKKARLSSKLQILKKLLEMQFDSNQKFKAEINRLTAAELRTEPIGRDKHGHAYWYQVDEHCQVRVYREDPDEETWMLVARDRDGFIRLISQLASNDPNIGDLPLNEDSSSLSIEKPIIDTGQTSSATSNCEVEVDESSAGNEIDESSAGNEIDESSAGNEVDESFVDIEDTKASGATDAVEQRTISKDEPILSVDETQLTKNEFSNNETIASFDVAKKSDLLVKVQDESVSHGITEQNNTLNELRGMDLSMVQSSSVISSNKKTVDLSHKRKKSINELAVNLRIKTHDQLCTPAVQEQEIDLSMKKNKVNPQQFSSLPVLPYEPSFIERALRIRTEYQESDEEFDDEEDEFDDSDEIELPSHIKRPRLDRPTLLGNSRKQSNSELDDEYGDEIEEEVMYVRGEGSGEDCENENILDNNTTAVEVSEAIEESVLLIFGEGSGYDCDAANNGSDEDNTTSDNKTDECKSSSSGTNQGSSNQRNTTLSADDSDPNRKCDNVNRTESTCSSSEGNTVSVSANFEESCCLSDNQCADHVDNSKVDVITVCSAIKSDNNSDSINLPEVKKCNLVNVKTSVDSIVPECNTSPGQTVKLPKVGKIVIDVVKSAQRTPDVNVSPVKKTSRWDVGKPSIDNTESPPDNYNLEQTKKIQHNEENVLEVSTSTNCSIQDKLVDNVSNDINVADTGKPKGNIEETTPNWESACEENESNIVISTKENLCMENSEITNIDESVKDNNKPLETSETTQETVSSQKQFFFGPGCFQFTTLISPEIKCPEKKSLDIVNLKKVSPSPDDIQKECSVSHLSGNQNETKCLIKTNLDDTDATDKSDNMKINADQQNVHSSLATSANVTSEITNNTCKTEIMHVASTFALSQNVINSDIEPNSTVKHNQQESSAQNLPGEENYIEGKINLNENPTDQNSTFSDIVINKSHDIVEPTDITNRGSSQTCLDKSIKNILNIADVSQSSAEKSVHYEKQFNIETVDDRIQKDIYSEKQIILESVNIVTEVDCKEPVQAEVKSISEQENINNEKHDSEILLEKSETTEVDDHVVNISKASSKVEGSVEMEEINNDKQTTQPLTENIQVSTSNKIDSSDSVEKITVDTDRTEIEADGSFIKFTENIQLKKSIEIHNVPCEKALYSDNYNTPIEPVQFQNASEVKNNRTKSISENAEQTERETENATSNKKISISLGDIIVNKKYPATETSDPSQTLTERMDTNKSLQTESCSALAAAAAVDDYKQSVLGNAQEVTENKIEIESSYTEVDMDAEKHTVSEISDDTSSLHVETSSLEKDDVDQESSNESIDVSNYSVQEDNDVIHISTDISETSMVLSENTRSQNSDDHEHNSLKDIAYNKERSFEEQAQISQELTENSKFDCNLEREKNDNKGTEVLDVPQSLTEMIQASSSAKIDTRSVDFSSTLIVETNIPKTDLVLPKHSIPETSMKWDRLLSGIVQESDTTNKTVHKNENVQTDKISAEVASTEDVKSGTSSSAEENIKMQEKIVLNTRSSIPVLKENAADSTANVSNFSEEDKKLILPKTRTSHNVENMFIKREDSEKIITLKEASTPVVDNSSTSLTSEQELTLKVNQIEELPIVEPKNLETVGASTKECILKVKEKTILDSEENAIPLLNKCDNIKQINPENKELPKSVETTTDIRDVKSDGLNLKIEKDMKISDSNEVSSTDNLKTQEQFLLSDNKSILAQAYANPDNSNIQKIHSNMKDEHVTSIDICTNLSKNQKEQIEKENVPNILEHILDNENKNKDGVQSCVQSACKIDMNEDTTQIEIRNEKENLHDNKIDTRIAVINANINEINNESKVFQSDSNTGGVLDAPMQISAKENDSCEQTNTMDEKTKLVSDPSKDITAKKNQQFDIQKNVPDESKKPIISDRKFDESSGAEFSSEEDMFEGCTINSDTDSENDGVSVLFSKLYEKPILPTVDKTIKEDMMEKIRTESNLTVEEKENIVLEENKTHTSVPDKTKSSDNLNDECKTVALLEEIPTENNMCKKDDINIDNANASKLKTTLTTDIADDDNKPVLMCIDITKLQDTSDTKSLNKTINELKIQSDISSPRSVESVGVDNDESSDIIDVPETDPLACTEEDILSVKHDENVQPTPPPSLSLATFKLDGTETDNSLIPEPIARALRNRKISMEAAAAKETRKRGRPSVEGDEPESNNSVDSKRRRMRGKRSIDVNLRRSVESKHAEMSSSEEESSEKKAAGENSPTSETVDSSATPKRGTGKARRGKGRGKGRPAVASTRTPPAGAGVQDSDLQSETSRIEGNITTLSSSTSVTKTPTSGRKKRRMLGLDIDPNILLEGSLKAEDSETTGRGTVVRQSRRIAQLKIKEEAERRKIEELTLTEIKEEQKKKKSKRDEDKDYKAEKKKRKQKQVTDEDDESDDDVVESSSKKARKKKRKHQDPRKLFNSTKPWQSSSDASTSNEEEEEEEEEVDEEPSDEEAVLKSDHEFSPESDLESNTEVQPLRRARTVKKESDTEEPTDEHACQKCGKADHPEWILLCDKCDCGWHCSCLRPALLVIPEGDWFCPPCQHVSLVEALKTQLTEYDKRVSRRDMEVRRQERLAYVGISLNNVLPTKEQDGNKQHDADEQEDGSEDESSNSESSSGSSSGDDSEPIYQLRERRQAHSYRFNDYDELINSAIQDELEAVKGAGNQGRGKDIATIVNAEKEEAKSQSLLGQQTQELPKSQEQQALKAPELETCPPVVPVYADKPVLQQAEVSEKDSEEELRVVPKMAGRKKHRKLNSLDISSEDDPDDDEDFKGTSGDEEDDLDDIASEDSDDFDVGRRGKRRSGPIRRSTRARTTRYDREFINDDSEDEEPRRKKTRSIWDESESEESDTSWGKRKKSKKQRQSSSPRISKKTRKKKKRPDDSDPDVPKIRKPKKPKIKFGGLNDSADDDDDDDDEMLTRRTRGKKINYIDALGSDSDEDKAVAKRIESEEEYVANEEDEEEDVVDVVEEDKDSDSDSTSGVRPTVQKKLTSVKSVRGGRGRGKGGIARTHKPVVRPAGSASSLAAAARLVDDIGEDDEDGPSLDIPVIAANPDDLNEEEVGTMMMENEEYAKKQLELMAIQLAKEKKKKEREAKKQREHAEPAEQPPVEPRKRGRRKKIVEAEVPIAQAQSPVVINPSRNTMSPFSQNPIPSLPKSIMPPLLMQPPNPSKLEGLIPPVEITSTVPTVVSELTASPPKRRGRGKGKKTLAAEAAAAAAVAAGTTASLTPTSPSTGSISSGPVLVPSPAAPIATNTAANPAIPDGVPTVVTTLSPNEPPTNLTIDAAVHGGKLGIASPPQPFSQSQPAPSVITRMLQSQPVSSQTFTTVANTMNQKYFGGMCEQQQQQPPPPPSRGPPPGQFSIGSRGRVPSPYRQSSPAGMNLYPGIRPVAPNSPHRLRSPGPPPGMQQQQQQQQMFHTTHHPMDPSPSGGGPINIVAAAAAANRDRHSPAIAVPPTVVTTTPLTSKDGPTPPPLPPPHYIRGPPMGPAGRFPPNDASPGPSLPPPVRHHMSFPQAAAHMQQPSPPSRAPPHAGNFSPYHPPPPPNYHYGAYPPAPSLAAADDALPPTDYQSSPYPEPQYTGESIVHSSDGSNSKPFDEEGSGEFGGLVSYFSSQREDDLDT